MTEEGARLAALFAGLDARDRATLLALAEFLARRTNAAAAVVELRPRRETVLQAVRRLNRSYPGLERARLLGPVGELLSRHLLDGQDAAGVIDALEALYAAEHGRLGRRAED